MRRINSIWMKRAVTNFLTSCALTGILFLFAVAPASATPATYSSTGFGFESVGLEALPVGSIDENDPFLLVGAPDPMLSLSVELLGSQDLCILVGTSNVCQADSSGVTGDFSALVSIEVNVIDPTLTGPFTLFLNSLSDDPAYDLADVTIELDGFAPMGLDTSAVPLFESRYDADFDSFVHIQDLAIDGLTVLADYVGWTVEDGDIVTFRYDVTGGSIGGVAPQLTANATPVVVPEPGVAVLMGLGLGGLALAGRRRR
jgi:hypothetical protein